MQGTEPAQSRLTEPSNGHQPAPPSGWNLGLIVGSLGVVFGDIGTSPLYSMKECFAGSHAIPVSQGNVFGVISLLFWTVVVVVCFKYVIFLLRADNKGEGGIFALLALVTLVAKTVVEWRMKKETDMLNTVLAPEKT